MAITLTPKLRKEYEDLFGSCAVKTGKVATVDGIRDKILGKLDRYEGIEKLTGVLRYVVAVIHNMEASLKFNGHLHNGDPLTAKTVNVPKGRPPGSPPFTCEASALDRAALPLDEEELPEPPDDERKAGREAGGFQAAHRTATRLHRLKVN